MPVLRIPLPWVAPSPPPAPPMSPSERAIYIERIAHLEMLFDRYTATDTVSLITLPPRATPAQLLILRPCVADTSITNGQYLCNRAREGGKLKVSCAQASISIATVNNSLIRGRDLAKMLDDGEINLKALAHGGNQACYDFHINYTSAQAEHHAKLEAVVTKVALHGKETLKTKELIVVSPESGEVVFQEEVFDSRTTTFDGAEAGRLLAIHDPGDYSLPNQLKLTGSAEIEVVTNSASAWFQRRLDVATPEEQKQLLDILTTLENRLANDDSDGVDKETVIAAP